MNEQINQKYNEILSQCLKFKKFKKLYGSLIKCVKPELKEKFETFQKTEFYYTENARDQWQIVDVSEKELSFLIKSVNTNYTLVLYNKITNPKSKSITETNANLDENNIAIFEITNHKKGVKFLLEYVEALDGERLCIVEKDYIWSTSENEWTLETDCVYLEEQEIKI